MKGLLNSCKNFGSGCFVAGTLVKTEDGYKNIEDIKVGDRVYSRNMLTEEEGYREVEEVFVREAEVIVHLTIGSTCIDATTNHPFWVEDYGFKPAGDLETGDVVATASGECVQVSDAEIEYLDEPVAVYNFEVMDWGTYYVSGLEVLVHNKCSEDGGSSNTIKFIEVKTYSAEETNQWFIDNVSPNYKPPYKPGTIVKEIELIEDTTFVRVYDNSPDGSGMYGSWLMRADDIEGLTPLEIQDKFALPNTPKYVCDVVLKSGTHVRVGEVNPLEGWGSGGGTQYGLIGQRIGEFKNERLLEGN